MTKHRFKKPEISFDHLRGQEPKLFDDNANALRKNFPRIEIHGSDDEYREWAEFMVADLIGYLYQPLPGAKFSMVQERMQKVFDKFETIRNTD